jgi:hypothetical protein
VPELPEPRVAAAEAAEVRNRLRVGGGGAGAVQCVALRVAGGVHRRRIRRGGAGRRGLGGWPGRRRTGGGGGSRKAGRRGGSGSAVGRGRRCQAARPALAAGVEVVWSSPAHLECGGGVSPSPILLPCHRCDRFRQVHVL